MLPDAGEGSHVVTATDAAGCVASDSFFVKKSPETAPNFTINNASGPAAADGSIIVASISGEPPFDFLWSKGDTTGNPLHLTPGP